MVRGIIAILFGLVCFFLTGAAILAIVIWIGVFFILDGILILVGAIRSATQSHESHWWWQLLAGVVGVGAGVVTFIWPEITALTLALLVAGWAIVTGVFELVTAIRLRGAMPNEWLWVFNGALSVLLGIAIFAYPGAGLVALVWLLGFYAIVAGVAMITLSLRLRSH